MIPTTTLLKLGVLGIITAMGSSARSQCSPDVTPPMITCPSNITANNDAGACTGTISFGSPVATDNCSTTGNQTFNFTGAVQMWTVPAGVTSITIECWGAQGNGPNGGLGGYAKGDMAVTPGQMLHIYVGGQNGYNGGGAGYAAVAKNGGGGTDVRLTGMALTDRVIVAGGGGGGGPTDVGTHSGGAGGGGTVGANYAGGGGGGGYGGAGGVGGASGGS